MNLAMATRTPKSPRSNSVENCTEFQLHVHHYTGSQKGHVRDYSEYRLMRYIEQTTEEQQKFTLENVLKEYRQGKVAIAWKIGRPVWLKVTREKV